MSVVGQSDRAVRRMQGGCILDLAAFLVTAGAIEFAAEPSLAAFLRRRPQAHAERRLMADVLPMPARQIGHPISVLILMKTNDLLFHPPASCTRRDITQSDSLRQADV